METGISVERAIELIQTYTNPVGTEQIPAIKAHGRVLAADVRSPIDQPPWPRSPLDGYAMRSEDTKSAPVKLTVADTVYAGGWCSKTVGAGECVRLMTGAPIPAGCDCVIRQEDTDGGTDTVLISKPLGHHENYCFAGEDFKEGDVLLPKGTRLCGNAFGVLAAAGLLRDDEPLTVYKPARCAVLCTGDELVPNTVRPLPKGKIYSSNEAVLSARLLELGIEITTVQGEFSDDPQKLADAIRKAAKDADVILTTGGVSVGAKDILHETLPILDAERIFWRVKLKPGTPLMFSLFEGKPILSLSGNPFAASATFELFARPMLASLCGCADLQTQLLQAPLETPFEKFGKCRRFVRAVLQNGRVILPKGHSSGQLASSVGTNCLAEIPPSDAPIETGTMVRVWIL